MTIQEVAMHLWPAWMMGIFMVCATWRSDHKELLKVDGKGIFKFLRTMCWITFFRFLAFKYLTPESTIESTKEMVHFLPWQTTLGVFWEDACHCLPIVIFSKMFKETKWFRYAYWPLLVLIMASFGSGHVYQGLFSALCISFYIPFSLKMGNKYGFGTVMIAHILYDLITLLSLGWMVGS